MTFQPKPVRRSEAGRRQLAEDYQNQEKLQLEEEQERQRASCEEGCHGSHRRHDCPNMPCNYCKTEGHTTPNCPGLARKRLLSTPGALQPAIEFPEPERHRGKHLQTERYRVEGPRWEVTAKEILPIYHCPGMSSLDENAAGARPVSKSVSYPDDCKGC